jgi:cellulose synthase/poly-beta-1,6-N-acetylglucosamine synthase-like glycosyltransferase
MTRVALVLTLLDEAEALPDLLAGIEAQTRQPDEVVVVDGGSRDGTAEALQAWAAADPRRTVLGRPGASISAGRNTAVGATSTGPDDVVAVTDGGCRLEPDWLEHLLRPFAEPDVGMAMGFYRPDARSTFEVLVSCLNLPDAAEVDPAAFLPSARSVAYRRSVFDAVGGYPEDLAIGEDMWFDLEVVRLGVRRVFVPEAVVHWRLRADVRSFLRQYYRYARGDGLAGMHPRRHAARFGTYGALAAALLAGRPRLALAPAAGLAWWLRPTLPRARRRLGPAWPVAVPAVPVLTVAMDAAKMAGYAAGTARRLQGHGPRGRR